MNNELFPDKEVNFRVLYGKLYAGLINKFGAYYINEIEDGIQNSFLNSIKIFKDKNFPENIENWLFIVARNDILNQIKKESKIINFPVEQEAYYSSIDYESDLRLQTIILLSKLDNISKQSKIYFILKHIFGLSIDEISTNILINQEALYKNISRTKKAILKDREVCVKEIDSITADLKTISIIEDILYAVFNTGFDSFNDKTENIVNKDLCLEAFALAKMLNSQYPSDSTSNLLALFCFHIARLPAKLYNGKLVPLLKQNRDLWNHEMINLGYYYLKKPKEINKIYLEVLIVIKYMSVKIIKQSDWEEIVKLYQIMQKIASSPIIKINYCYCLSRIGRTQDALDILKEIEHELPKEHVYFSLVKAKILKESNLKESEDLFNEITNKMNQKVRKEYLFENELIHFL